MPSTGYSAVEWVMSPFDRWSMGNIVRWSLGNHSSMSWENARRTIPTVT